MTASGLVAVSDEATALPPGPISRRTMSSDGRFAVANDADRVGAGDGDRVRGAAAVGAVGGAAGEGAGAVLAVGGLLDLVGTEQHLAGARVDERAVRPHVAAVGVEHDRLERGAHALREGRERDEARALVDPALGARDGRRGEALDARTRSSRRGSRAPVTSVAAARTPALPAARSQASTGLSVAAAGAAWRAGGRGRHVRDAAARHADGDHAAVAGGQAAEALPEEHGVPVAAGELRVVDEIEGVDVGGRQPEQVAVVANEAARATSAALPAEAPVRKPSPAISEAGVP